MSGMVAARAWAVDVATRFLDVPEFRDRRWKHVQAVGGLAEAIAPAFGEDGPLLVASAWLHDIGYAPQLQRSGFHPLDGAWHLDECKVGKRLSGLVANHSAAADEAVLRGLMIEMEAFPDEAGAVRDALWACDMTTSPVGERVDFGERLREITARYGAEHTLTRALRGAAGEILDAIERTRVRVAGQGIDVDF
jgi:hypothetical protein